MTQFKAFENGMQVNGVTIMTVVAGLGAFKTMALKFLADNGLKDIIADESHWYSQQAWLDVFKKIAEELGDNTLQLIGQKIPENAIFPKEIDNIEKALAAIDIAYHMNHRNAVGEVLFDPTRPPARMMIEGIGHYGCQKLPNENRMILVCENPYPCAFDRGIIQTMALRFNSRAIVKHDDTKLCRKKGADSCTYIVKWS